MVILYQSLDIVSRKPSYSKYLNKLPEFEFSIYHINLLFKSNILSFSFIDSYFLLLCSTVVIYKIVFD